MDALGALYSCLTGNFYYHGITLLSCRWSSNPGTILSPPGIDPNKCPVCCPITRHRLWQHLMTIWLQSWAKCFFPNMLIPLLYKNCLNMNWWYIKSLWDINVGARIGWMKVFCTVMHPLRHMGAARVQEGGKCALLRERLAFRHTTEVSLDNFGQNSICLLWQLWTFSFDLSYWTYRVDD